MKTIKDFADLVKLEMKEQGLKDKELATAANVSASCIWGLCNGYNAPNVQNTIKILDALGYDIALVQKDKFIA